ncbi:hypothetical protein HMPREF9436_02056 [Faecalibacterium cf. prausnitzii KLE1255]|uniref:Uncharacterized protein n=1 Tax=Faecalibacterium cf. prausnitzii KLE1255 TaxID=748224 RepID=E2ZK54_9FIRM|nr:hypothetical protein HMPREF9436_02056 [Faecalibacterium cf. prausnitzii KLE1255]
MWNEMFYLEIVQIFLLTKVAFMCKHQSKCFIHFVGIILSATFAFFSFQGFDCYMGFGAVRSFEFDH